MSIVLHIENWEPRYNSKGNYWYLYDIGNNAKVNELRFKSEQEALNWKLNYENSTLNYGVIKP